jgi:hypothetical protein
MEAKMAEPENQAPVFLRLTAEGLTDDGNIVLQFLAKDDQLYRVEIAKPIIGAVVLNIIGLLNKTQLATLDTTRRRSDPLMSLQLTAFRAMVTPKGAPGLAMVLANALEVGIELKREAIPVLKSVLDQLENLTSPPNDAQKH